MSTATQTLSNFIGGDWVEATGTTAREVVSPVSGETIGAALDASPEDVRGAVAAARLAQQDWGARSAFDRAAICVAIADAIEARKESLARDLTREQGKPYLAEALPEVEVSAEAFRCAAEDVKRLESSVLPSQQANKRIMTFRRPNGVYASITPWNAPMVSPACQLAPGIAVGNTFVVKPSEWTPMAMANLMDAMADAGLPDGVVNVIYGAGQVGEALVTSDGVDCVAFVGSHDTAERVVRAAGLKRTWIEASGNGPVVVCEDADLELAARGAVSGAFYNAGQVCCATERVLVHRDVRGDFLAAVNREAAQWSLGDPFEEATRVGPLNNEPVAQKMDDHVEDAVAKGAEVVVGGGREDGLPTRLYYQPTVLDNVGRDTLVNREETFGPIVPLIAVDGDEDAITVANDSHLGLQAAVYTSSIERAFRYIDNLRVGGVMLNESLDYFELHQPFGGAAGTRTGWGRLGGRQQLLDMTDLRTLVLDTGGRA